MVVANVRPGSPLQYLSSLAELGDHADLRGQFVLGSPPPAIPDGWRRQQHGRWTLAVHPDLPVRSIADGSGRTLGWLLGRPLLPGATAPTPDTVRLDGAVRDAAGLDASLHAYAGRWLALAVELETVVPDSNATLPAVFDPGRGVLSSSPFLLQPPDEPPPDDALARLVRTYDSGLWFLFDTTPHARAHRLLPNHSLDLGTWEQTRRWPAAPLAEVAPEEATETMISSLEGVIAAAVADAGPLQCALTAGGDTRQLLAASRPLLDHVEFFTVSQPDHVGRRDVRIARRLSERFALRHRVLHWKPPSHAELARFMFRTGGLVGERRGRAAGPTYAQLDEAQPHVSGVNGAVGNAWIDLGWRPTDHAETPISPRDLLTRFSSPHHPRLVERATWWLEHLHAFDSVLKMSLATDELRVGCWGGALTTAYPEAGFTLYPFSFRPIKAALFAAAHDYRRSGNVRFDSIRRRWPELLDVPINPVTPGYRLGTWRFRAAGIVDRAARAARIKPP